MGLDNNHVCQRHTDIRSNHMNNYSNTTVRPVQATRLTHYYQGRPNTVFLQRYRTGAATSALRSA